MTNEQNCGLPIMSQTTGTLYVDGCFFELKVCLWETPAFKECLYRKYCGFKGRVPKCENNLNDVIRLILDWT